MIRSSMRRYHTYPTHRAPVGALCEGSSMRNCGPVGTHRAPIGALCEGSSMRLYSATRQHLGTTILYSLHLNIFNHHEIPLSGKLSNVDSENLEFCFHSSHLLLGSVLRYGFKTSSGMVPFVEQARMYKLYPTTAGFKAVMRRQRHTKHMQKFYHP